MKTSTEHFSLILVAGGSGTRFGAGLPKQYHKLGAKTVIAYALQAYNPFKPQNIVIVVEQGMEAELQAALSGINMDYKIAYGGKTRQQSVFNGLKALPDSLQSDHKVLVHDAARPNVAPQTILNILSALDNNPCVTAAINMADTLRLKNGAPLNRNEVQAIQTPQGFHYQPFFKAHTQYLEAEATDDTALMQLAGISTFYVAGNRDNIKVTERDDLELLEKIMFNPKYKTATGYDIHAFEDGDFVTLCGIKIAHSRALKGHSDADVALHALADALYSLNGNGDIGIHFPPTDASIKGIDSAIILKAALKSAHDYGAKLTHIDLTLVCEEPKISPHNLAMRQNLAALTGLELEDISLKATTAEKLGAIGRKEGIECFATVSAAIYK